MSNHNKRSRINKFEKRRKNTKAISILFVVGGILILLLISVLIFEGTNNEPVNQVEEDNETVRDSTEEEGNEGTVDEISGDPDSNDENVENIELVIELLEPSDDDNIIEAYIGNWEPIGTEQSEPHTTNYSDNSQDRKEIERAIRTVTELDEDNMVTLWIGNGGEQKVIGTVSNQDQTEFYRVYLNWVENQGWRPTKVEVLKESDKN